MDRILPDNVFRASVGAVIANGSGQVLAFERADIEGAFQLPQGGLEEGEDPLDAVYREIREETGIDRSKLAFAAEHPEWLVYALDKENGGKKHGRGQVQKWYLFRFVGDESDIDLSGPGNPEFRSWKWTTLDDLIPTVPSFRKPVYTRVWEAFNPFLQKI